QDASPGTRQSAEGPCHAAGPDRTLGNLHLPDDTAISVGHRRRAGTALQDDARWQDSGNAGAVRQAHGAVQLGACPRVPEREHRLRRRYEQLAGAEDHPAPRADLALTDGPARAGGTTMAKGSSSDLAAKRLRLVVAAASMGTALEWYDFFVFGSLASVITDRFTGGSGNAGFIFTLGAFAAGFVVRPFGALFFGRMGDRRGRKRAFLVTITLMGAATVGIGLLPTMARVGLLAPALLVAMRVLQGFAMGGEYGGAAVYVAEHARPDRRGFLTSWIQIT